MTAIKVKLVRGLAGCPATHRVVVRGRGLGTRDSTRLPPDPPASRGEIDKVSYLVAGERVDAAPPPGRAARKAAAAKAR